MTIPMVFVCNPSYFCTKAYSILCFSRPIWIFFFQSRWFQFLEWKKFMVKLELWNEMIDTVGLKYSKKFFGIYFCQALRVVERQIFHLMSSQPVALICLVRLRLRLRIRIKSSNASIGFVAVSYMLLSNFLFLFIFPSSLLSF